MCFPCWPFADVYVEEVVPKKEKGTLYYDPNSKTWVKLIGTKTKTATQPVFYQPPAVLSTPLVTPPPAIYQQPYMYPGMQPYPVVQGHPHLTMPGAYPPFTQPAFGSMGFTGGENMLNQMAFAQNQDLNKKQDMKPADDDPLRMYWVREPDNTWTQRNRITIDSGDIGDVRWYAMDGQFYAVRQSAG